MKKEAHSDIHHEPDLVIPNLSEFGSTDYAK